MNILLVNPPNCGRSIPEERYGITSIKQIFRGEPLGLMELAGNLTGHEVRLLDLKADPNGLDKEMATFSPDVIGLTSLTCEANTVVALARQLRDYGPATVVVGGIHASNDPNFFNQEGIDFIVSGLGKRSFAELVTKLELQDLSSALPAGVLRVTPGKPLARQARRCDATDLVETWPAAYHLVERYRDFYVLERLGLRMGLVASAYGCTHACTFCAMHGQTGGSYLGRPVAGVVRDIELLPENIPVVRLVDANTFGDTDRAMLLAEALMGSGMRKHYLADVRSDTVVRQPQMMAKWAKAGLRAVVIGFEAVDDAELESMNKANKAAMNDEAIDILHGLGIAIVGDFIISPEAEERHFDILQSYLHTHAIDLPMLTVMTPLPGTPLYKQQYHKIINHNLDYYTLTNAVLPTRLAEERFYAAYAELISEGHRQARL